MGAWAIDNPVRRLIEAGRFQDAICEIERANRAAFPRSLIARGGSEPLGSRNFAALRRAA